MFFLDKIFLLHLGAWTVSILFWSSLIPQIALNHKLRSARGISDWMLLGLFNGYIAYVYYAFCYNFPLSYKVMVPISLATVLILLGQRFFYEARYKQDQRLLFMYGINSLLAFGILPFAFKYRYAVGNIAGWMEFAIWTIYQFPQILKIHKNKSVVGFSFSFATLMTIGFLIELIIAFNFNLPIQTVLNGCRGIGIYLIFCLQFLLYAQQNHQK